MNSTQRASYILDTDTYVAHGGFNDGTQQWADTFKALGGESCGISFPKHLYGDRAPDAPVMDVIGTPEALAFVEDTVAA